MWPLSRSLARRSRGPLLGGLWLHARIRWIAPHLDRQLAAGTDPILSDELSLRVGQLGSARARTRLAHELREAVALANGNQAPLLTTRLRRPQIQANRELLLALADRVGDGAPLGAQGLAMTARLLHDRRSPLYRSGASASLPTALVKALGALDRGQRTAGTAERGSAAGRQWPGADANVT